MAERNNIPPRMTALGLLEQMRRSNAANREPEFNPINAMRRAAPSAPLFGGQRQPPLPIPPRPPAVIPPPPPQQAAPQAAAAPQARTPAQALPLPPRPPQLGADGNPIPPAVLPQVPGAEPQPLYARFNPENPYVATATQMAERYGLPPNVFLSLVHQESRFRPDAVSRVGATGLGQLMPGTARELGVDPNDPMQNLEGSARYLRQQLDRFGGDMTLALAAYNAGPRRVAEAGNAIPNNAETRAYVPGVMRNAGVPGYAEGGLAELEHKYAAGDLVVVPGAATSLPTYDIDVRATRIPRRRAPRPAPREELTADQLNGMVLDILARRAAAEPEAGAAVEARERIGRTMGFAEGGLADLHQKYESGGIVRRVARRALRGAAPEPTASIPQAAMTPDEAMTLATAPQPGAGVPRLEGDDLERANELSQRVLDFRASQMRLPPKARVQPRPEDQLFPAARFDQPLEAGPSTAAQDLEALRIGNIAPNQSLPGSRAGAGVASDLAENYGSTLDRIVGDLDPIARIMRGEEVPGATASQIASARAGEFYNMRPVYDVLRGQGVSHDEALRRIRQESQAIAGTSPRTDTEQNVLNSAFLQNRMARGLPVDAASVQASTGPGSGYGMIYDQHPALTQGLLEGTVSLAQNPKPSVFARNIAGDRSAVTADVHNVRAINMLYNDVNPGNLPASSFESAKQYQRYRDAYTPDADGNVRGMADAELREILVARPSGQGIRGQNVSTEYPIYNDITTQIGERLGLTPADAHTVPELLNQRMSITSQGLDMPPEEVMRLYTRNMIPLAGVAPAAILAREGEAAPSLEELDQRYAEGGRVMSDEEYDRRLLARMKRDTGRTTESTNAEQARALRSAGYDAAGLASDIFMPQSPLDAALMVALGPGGRMARLAGSTALMAMEPSEAEAGGLRRLIRAYHGSPHEFAAERLIRRPGGETEFMVGATDRLPDVPEGVEVMRDYPLGRLRMDKIGTGAGAQAYTHGLYFGEAEDTARHIRDKLSQPSSGRIYEVDIDASPDRLMDWYLPRSQQPGPVQDALRSLGSRIPEETPIYGAMNRSRRNSLFAGNVIGADTATPAEVSDRLREAGIQGLTYLEPGSRTAEIAPRSRNYVIYDPEIIDITRRYAQGGLAQLEHKYAEGGAVSAQPAIYDPDAVNALANQIEADYV